MVGLQGLYLSENQIVEIKGLEHLVGLQTLYLFDNQIAEIKSLDHLVDLQHLDLSYNQIEEIQGLDHLIVLQELNLSKNKIACLNWGSYFKRLLEIDLKLLNVLELRDNPIKHIPAEIIAGHRVKPDSLISCKEELVMWYADLDKGKATSYHLKLMLIGNGNAGKTTLVDALKNGESPTTFDSTHGILIEELSLYNEDPLKLFCWDFGGQEIFHGTHRLFMSSKGIQLIVVDPAFENKSIVEDRITYEKQRNLKAVNWLSYVQHFSPKSEIIIVQNKMDDYPKVLKQVQQQAIENEIPFIQLSARKGINIDELLLRLKKVAHSFNEYGMPMPKSWFDVRATFLDNLMQALPQRTISYKHFEERCRKLGVSELSIPILLKYLHDTGIIYYNKQFLTDTIIADQRWALAAIYKVLDREEDFYKMLRYDMKGICRVRYTFNEFGEEYSDAHKELFLDFMLSCGLCFMVKDKYQQNKITPDSMIVFSEFLSETITPTAALLLEAKHPEFIYLQKKTPFLYYYTIQQFIALVSSKTDLSLIWRNGIVVDSMYIFKVEGDFDNNIIQIAVDKNAPLEFIKEIIYQIEGNRNEELEGWQTVDGKEVKNVFFEKNTDKDGNINEGRAKTEINTPTLSNLPTKQQVRPKEIVFSYAKEDIGTLLLIRSAFNALSNDNRVCLWYDHDLTNRNKWNDEIESRFKNCDAVIIIGSDDYMSKDKSYIWQEEIPLILKRFQEEHLFVVRINAGYCDSSEKINSINCYKKEKPIPSSKNASKKFLLDFINGEIKKKLLKTD